MTTPNVIFHDEVQLLDWGESRSTGPWVKLRLTDPDLLDVFRSMDIGELKKTGHIFSCTLVDGDIMTFVEPEEKPEERQAEHGKFWQKLISSGFFRPPAVCQAIGSEKTFEDWIRRQPSVLSSCGDWDAEKGEERCEVSHIRRIKEGSGTAEKPPYFAVPMRHQEHQMLHQQGESECCAWFGPVSNAVEWLEKKADQYRTEWASKALAQKLMPGCKSRSAVPAEKVLAWADEHNLIQYVPAVLRNCGISS